MSLGPCMYAGWFGILIASQLLAGRHMNRSGTAGVIRGFVGIIGAFLCWAFVSAYCGVMEMPGYVSSRAFDVSIGLGVFGLILFLQSCLPAGRKQVRVFNGGAA